MKVTYTKKIIKNINECINQCPYFEFDGSPIGLPNNSDTPLYYEMVENTQCGEMICTHSKAPDNGYIIAQQDIGNFPPKCPVLNEGRK